MKTINGKEEFEVEVIQSDVPVVVDFHADWCIPCQWVSPILEELSQKYGVKFVGVDAEENLDLADMFLVKGLPTVLIFSDGLVKDVVIGAGPSVVYAEKIQKIVEVEKK